MQPLFQDIGDCEKEAIVYIRTHEPSEGYMVAFSGGKDSVIVYDLVKKSGVKHIAYYSATGIDPPEIMKFIKQEYPEIKWARPKNSFFHDIKRYGLPTLYRRWCCDSLKKKPTWNIPPYHRITGVRAEESKRRMGRGRTNKFKSKNIWMYCPIFYWKEWQVWEYIEKNNLPYCSLYDDPNIDRIGCVLCPLINSPSPMAQTRLLRMKNKWPKYYIALEKAARKYWEMKNPKDGLPLQEYYSSIGLDITFKDFMDDWYQGGYVLHVKRKQLKANNTGILKILNERNGGR